MGEHKGTDFPGFQMGAILRHTSAGINRDKSQGQGSETQRPELFLWHRAQIKDSPMLWYRVNPESKRFQTHNCQLLGDSMRHEKIINLHYSWANCRCFSIPHHIPSSWTGNRKTLQVTGTLFNNACPSKTNIAADYITTGGEWVLLGRGSLL